MEGIMADQNQAERLQKLRALMQQQNIDYYYVPAEDPHFNEYVPACWERRSFISGFTGSAGTALIGLEQAWLWTDPRYFLQAEDELDPDLFVLMRQQQGMAPVHVWLQQQAQGKTVALDSKLISVSSIKKWQRAFDKANIKLLCLDGNLIDQTREDMPAVPAEPVVVYPIEYAGRSLNEKLKALRVSHQELGVDAEVISTLDAICWLLNIRGSDIAYNPVTICYAIVTTSELYLFIESSKISTEVAKYLDENNVKVVAYSEFSQALNTLQGEVLIDPAANSAWVQQQIGKGAAMVYHSSPVHLAKACKNKVEQDGMQEAHRRDAIALINFLAWVDENGSSQTEWSLVQKLLEFRQQDSHFKQNSFATICGFADHGAVIHYRVTEESSYPITDQNLLLLDSGGHYDQGTTDVTRMIHLGTPTDGQRHHYTLVMKGHLALRHALFPHGMCGMHLNALAHMPLWQEKLDFGHGTGHGVGCYLCVHEGPQRISHANIPVPLLPGMIVSNEPGVYFTGQYGIRIENLCVIKQAASQEESATGHGPFYHLYDLTLVPHERKLIDKNMLTSLEIHWLDKYHRRILDTLLEDLDEKERAWLEEACQPL